MPVRAVPGAGESVPGSVCYVQVGRTLPGMASADQRTPPGSSQEDLLRSGEATAKPGRLAAIRVGTAFTVLFLLVLLAFAVVAGQHHQWARVAGFVLLVLVVLAIPAGGIKWLGHLLRGGKTTVPPAEN